MDAAQREVTGDDATRIAYSVYDGEQPAVVILHGLAGSSREFAATARALNAGQTRRTVVLIDQRGHGSSTTHPADTSREAFVDDVVRVIEAEALGKVDLVGQSMGAHTAMLVAAARPDVVRRLVLLEANEGGGDAENTTAIGDYFRSWPIPFASREHAREFLGDGPLARAWTADLEDRDGALHPRFDVDVMIATLSTLETSRWREWVDSTVPTLVMYADGGMFSASQKARFVGAREGVTRVDLAHASHDAHLDAFPEWIQALQKFIERD